MKIISKDKKQFNKKATDHMMFQCTAAPAVWSSNSGPMQEKSMNENN